MKSIFSLILYIFSLIYLGCGREKLTNSSESQNLASPQYNITGEWMGEGKTAASGQIYFELTLSQSENGFVNGSFIMNRYNISPPSTEGHLEGNYSTLFRFTMTGGNNSCTDSIFGLAEVLNADSIKIKSLTGKDCSHDFMGGKALLIRE